MKIVLDGDMSQGHNGYPPVPIHASSNVTINGKKIALNGDSYSQHCKDSCHVPIIIGTSSVTINGIALALEGDSTNCGDHATSSSSVNVS